MTTTFNTSRRIEFRETDAAGIAHYSTFIHLMEEAEHELLRSLGFSVISRDEQGEFSWPRVAVHCEYQSAVRFEDVIDIAVGVRRLGAKSVTYQFDMSHQGKPVADGWMTAVCCRLVPGEGPVSIEIPTEMREQLEPFLTDDKG